MGVAGSAARGWIWRHDPGLDWVVQALRGSLCVSEHIRNLLSSLGSGVDSSETPKLARLVLGALMQANLSGPRNALCSI